ncbi:HD domain-containing protein [Dictyobacter kobayashii]|uniref:Phosphodiesterase n=1 Tax=Dictyobacter kobayashii TaxID=2014872 RepID=A0A402AZ50_9CHLR|nr:HD domain-containing protein [Dictyobacter kobayashii]GCE24358.1 phosphodiesterase [Dictyobacter kobayashii]
MHFVEPFSTADQAWQALVEQQGMSDGEVIDLWQHQLQTAEELRLRGADEELIIAGLLHDLGDGRVQECDHATWAAHSVRPLLGERIAWVIGAHAEAKRYMCTVDTDYWGTLSAVSQKTLLRQGGLMAPEEVAEFQQSPWFSDALFLRQCDDAGKKADHRVADPQLYHDMLDRVVQQRRNNSAATA